MADPPRHPDADTGRGPTAGTPRWVKVSGVITIVVIVLFVLLFVVRGPHGGHGPGRHFSLPAVTAYALTRP